MKKEELKTLKDLEMIENKGYKPFPSETVALLKQEAIKWIKELKEAEKFNIEFASSEQMGYFHDNQFDDFVDNQGKAYWVINWIKWFFNITEEDLK